MGGYTRPRNDRECSPPMGLHDASACDRLGTTRKKHDGQDLSRILGWMDENNPFDTEVTELRSLSTGLVARAEDGVNCDDAESVGAQILFGLDDVLFKNAKIKKCQHARTLASLKPVVKVQGKTVNIEPSTCILFLRCCTIAQRLDDDQVQVFDFEMTTFPASLFTDGFMRKATKSDLANAIQSSLTNHISDPTQTPHMTVIDGGWLIHRMRWRNGSTYGDIVADYVDYVNRHFGPSVIIFDG